MLRDEFGIKALGKRLKILDAAKAAAKARPKQTAKPKPKPRPAAAAKAVVPVAEKGNKDAVLVPKVRCQLCQLSCFA